MSNIRLISSGIPNLLPMQDRSPGIHHSHVLSDLCIRLGHYDKKDMSMSRMQLGCALEDTIADRYAEEYPDRYIRPGELLLGDLPITKDLLDVYSYVPEEIKLSWISSRNSPDSEKFIRFWWQVKSQCCALKTRKGRLNITHINGDYDFLRKRKPGDPPPKFEVHNNVWEQEWSKADLEDHKIMILRHRDRMLREGWKED